MKCSKCGCEIYQGKFCQNCGSEIKFPNSMIIITIICFILSRLIGIICLSMCTMCKTYLKKDDLVSYQKWLDVSKIVCISGLVIAIIINIVYICLNVF